MMNSEKLIQQLAVDALNIWRDHILILADALEQDGRLREAKELRACIGAEFRALPVDHRATRDRTISVEAVAYQLLRLAKPKFYLSRSTGKSKFLHIWTRHHRKRVYSFRPSKDPDGQWLPHTAIFKQVVTRAKGFGEDTVTLHLSSEIIEGCADVKPGPVAPVHILFSTDVRVTPVDNKDDGDTDD